MTDKRLLGSHGEEAAVHMLLEAGYTILERNWTFGHLEVDIIALDGEVLVFAEVKTRSAGSLVPPQQAVNPQKQKNIIRAANYYVIKHEYTYEVRFDIITVIQGEKGVEIEHLKDAYAPKW
ncbi:MAG: YraN family protein [Bacteroidales bacterium]|nr:YraN family protein [Bacteroidales bacterium]